MGRADRVSRPSLDEDTTMNPVPANKTADSGQQCESTQPLSGQTVDLAPEGERAEPIPDVTGEVKADSSLTVDVPSDSGGSDVESVDTLRPEQKTKTRELPLAAAPPGYEILGVLGRGGMGVVYDARQIALKRRVALKMVTSGAHTGPAERTRFQIEAEAVAALQHPNIVQIYEVGEHDGIPYFSLEYVGGGSLEKKIKRQPMPPRDAAGLVQSLAVAMDYAHERGIVHRDLKPANVLMTADGLPKITDFGLAKRLGDSDSSQTQAGTILGTPSYMAPEQAEGEVKEVGTLADVYSLGAVLYQLLTGRPPFQGTTLLETLELVRTQEPVPVRQLQPKVARDLETICLKCLQKQPAKRYIDAGALATDLGHFLANEPIEARPVGQVERLWRWCRRNPGIAALTAAVFLLLVVGVIGSTASAITIARERDQKESERQAADAARQLAERRKQEADDAHDQARKNADEALKQGALALGAFSTLINEVQNQIGDSPGMQPLKAKLLETALDNLDKVAKSDEDARLQGRMMANAYMRMGQLFQQLGQSEKAYTQYQKCHDIIQALAARDPKSDKAQANLAATFTQLGEMSLELRRDMRASLTYYQKALDIRKLLVGRPLTDSLDPVKVKGDLAESYMRVGVTHLRLGEVERAGDNVERALELRQQLVDDAPTDTSAQVEVARSYRLDLARSYMALAEVRFRSRDWDSARVAFAHGLALCERVHLENAKKPQYKLEFANTLGNVGVFEVRTGRLDEARTHYGRYLMLMQELADLDPKNVYYQRYLGLANYRLATLARRVHDADTAQRCNQKCLEIREKLAAADAKSERRRMELILVLPRCGQHVRAAEEAAKFLNSSTADREVLYEVAQCYAQCAAAVSDAPELAREYRDKASEALTRALAQGFKDLVILETEPDLDALRDQPTFQALLATLKKGV
jgi:serine/threonine-protein kinase